jgi:hypothetical protein
MAVTRIPKPFNKTPVEEAIIPFPTPLITPPVITTYFMGFEGETEEVEDDDIIRKFARET